MEIDKRVPPKMQQPQLIEGITRFLLKSILDAAAKTTENIQRPDKKVASFLSTDQPPLRGQKPTFTPLSEKLGLKRKSLSGLC
jgi:hypothetical protein